MPKSEVFPVEWRALSAVTPYAGNPRVIPQSAVEKVAASIKEFGWRQPLVVDEAGVLLVGHTRRLAALKLKLKRVPVHVAAGLTEDQKRAYRLADNRVAEETRWEPIGLRLELSALGDVGFDLQLTGFDPVQLPAMTPDFKPQDVATSKPLDRLSEFKCPHCGLAFEAGARR